MNLTVQTPDEKLGALAMPSTETVSRLRLSDEDWLVVCAGFEDRALGVLQNTVISGTRPNVLLVNYAPFFEENKAVATRAICKHASLQVSELTYNREEPSGFGTEFIETLSSCRGRVFVDVSAMSRLLIVQVVVALGARREGFHNCFLIYAEAKSYSPNEEEAKAELAKSELDPTFSVLFLSSGVFQITLIPELSSSSSPSGAQTRLVAFPSLDAHHLTALRAEIQPSRFSFIEGVPPNPHNRWRRGIIAAVNRLDQFPDAERYQTSTLDYRETLDCLLGIYSKHAIRERLLIAPTGSKMQTIAVGLFRSFVEDVQIVFPTPRSFCKPDGYSFGVGDLHMLDLGAFSLVATAIE